MGCRSFFLSLCRLNVCFRDVHSCHRSVVSGFVALSLVLSVIQILFRDDPFALIKQLIVSLEIPLGIDVLSLSGVRLCSGLFQLSIGLDQLCLACPS